MRLTSQLITETFSDLDKVERLNIEAFPEEERIPLSEFLRYTDNDDAHFFAFYNEEEFVGFAFAISNAKAFYVSFFAIMPHLRSHGYGQEIIEQGNHESLLGAKGFYYDLYMSQFSKKEEAQ